MRAFSTEQVPSTASLAAWRDFMSEVYYCVDVKPSGGDGAVRGELLEAMIGPIGSSKFIASKQRVFRYAAAAKNDLQENLVFIFPLSNEMYFEQRGRSGFVGTGDVVILNSSEYYEAACDEEFENITLKIPSHLLTERLPGINDLCARNNFANLTLSRTLGPMIKQIMRPDNPWSSNVSEKLSNVVLDLICLMVDSKHRDDRDGYENRSLTHLMYQRLTAYMQANLSDFNLSPTKIANVHRISTRYLFKIFQLHGTTFGHELMEMRLQAARRQALVASETGLTLQQIAFSCGFSHQSHFSTRYRERFGESPRESRDLR